MLTYTYNASSLEDHSSLAYTVDVRSGYIHSKTVFLISIHIYLSISILKYSQGKSQILITFSFVLNIFNYLKRNMVSPIFPLQHQHSLLSATPMLFDIMSA